MFAEDMSGVRMIIQKIAPGRTFAGDADGEVESVVGSGDSVVVMVGSLVAILRVLDGAMVLSVDFDDLDDGEGVCDRWMVRSGTTEAVRVVLREVGWYGRKVERARDITKICFFGSISVRIVEI